jgi:hypothetical protein
MSNSPRARRLLESALPLPMVRLQPLHLPCTIDETWAPFIQRSDRLDIAAHESVNVPPAEQVAQTGRSAC